MKISSLMSGTTVVVGLNGALQKRFILPQDDQLIPGNVHRAKETQIGVGGKGQDVAVTLNCLDFSAELQLAQFLGIGAEGDLVNTILEDLMGKDSMGLTVRTSGPLRTCTTIVASDGATELVEPSAVIKESEMEELMNKLAKVRASALCFMGSMPPGCSQDTYAKIYKTAANPNALCLIDSTVGLEPLLKAIAETNDRGPAILKLNAAEICRLAGVKKTTSETGGVLEEEIVQAVTDFLKMWPYAAQALSAIAITDGAHPGYLASFISLETEDEFRLFQSPISKLEEEKQDSGASGWGHWAGSQSSLEGAKDKTIYPIGAGDAVAGGMLAAWKSLTDGRRGTPCVHPNVRNALMGNENPTIRVLLSAFAFGLACGSASCLQEENSVLKIEDVLNLYNKEGRPRFMSSHKLNSEAM